MVLTDNFRSRQPILDAAYRLIRHNDPDRLEAREGLDKRLVARARFGRATATVDPIELLAFDTGSDEADAIAERIAASLRAGRRAGDHAILVRTNRDADPILRALNMARIPWRFAGTAGLYRQPEVRLLVSFLRAVNDPEDSVSCYDLATSEIFGLDPQDVTRGPQRGQRAAAPPRAALREAPASRARRRFGQRRAARSSSGCWPASTSTAQLSAERNAPASCSTTSSPSPAGSAAWRARRASAATSGSPTWRASSRSSAASRACCATTGCRSWSRSSTR